MQMQNRKFTIVAGVLLGTTLVSVFCVGYYAFGILPRSAASRATQQAVIVAQNIQVMASLTEMARQEMTTPTGTPAPLVSYTIDMYGLNLKMPMGWKLQETNRRPEPTGLPSLSLGHDCADYVATNPDGSGRLAIYPPCESSNETSITCPTDSVVITPSGSDEIIVRYFDAPRGAYSYSRALSPSSISGSQDFLSCFDSPIMKVDDMFLRIEFQYVGPESGKDALLNLVDQIVLSIQKQ